MFVEGGFCMSNQSRSKMANTKGKKGHLESCPLASDLYFFRKGSGCTSQMHQQLPSRVGIAHRLFLAGVTLTKFCHRSRANFVYKHQYF